MSELTPSQTVGPFLHIALEWDDGPHAVPPGTPGAFWVTGVVYDGAGDPVTDALVESWQADPDGRFDHPGDPRGAVASTVPGFRGFARSTTDAEGHYRFVTVRPGAYPWKNHDNAWRPAHIHFSLFGRSFTQRLVTQMYFPDDPLFSQDPIFNAVRDEKARQRMVSRYDHTATQAEWALGFRFDIVLRGEQASVFEDDDDDE